MATDVAVLMAARNAEATIRDAVRSALANTLPCRLFVVDDASRMPVSQVLADVPGIDIIRSEVNVGPAGARNAGLARILAGDYRYVAILDADDVCDPARFARQVAFLDAYPDVAAVGSGVRVIGGDSGSAVKSWREPSDHETICRHLYYNNAIAHPTLMMRVSVLRTIGPYSLDYPAAEDYELMRRISRVARTANLPDLLLDYRISGTGVSLSRRKRQLFDRLRVQFAYFEPLQWRAWVGVVRTLACFLVPWKLLNAVKLLSAKASDGGTA